MDLKEAALLGDAAGAHWYYRSKAAAVLRYLDGRRPRRVLDVGAGSGFFTRYLLEHSAAASGVCVDTGYEREREERCVGKRLTFCRAVDAESADLVLLMDVLEHVDDDVALLREYAGKVSGGTSFLITVPAFQWMWSEHDVFLEHRRRYTVAQLERVVGQAGLDVARSSYFFGLVFPAAVLLRLAGRLRSSPSPVPKSQLSRHSAPVNAILGAVCRAELPLLRFNRIGGLSVFCLARKPG
jgi:SAM-dependent methyltransferase